jgi:hypothetical protein
MEILIKLVFQPRHGPLSIENRVCLFQLPVLEG